MASRRATSRAAHRFATALTVALALALALVLVPAAEGRVKDSALIELNGLAKRIDGLKKGNLQDGGGKRLRRTIAEIAAAKHAFISTHLGSERVYGMDFVLLFRRLESVDLELARARHAARRDVSTRSLNSHLNQARIALFDLDFGFDGFVSSSAPEAAKTDLDIIQNDLLNVIRGVRNSGLSGKKLRRRIGRLERAKLEMIGEHFGSQLVCGVSFDLLFRQLEGIDLHLERARTNSQLDKSKRVRRHLAAAASLTRALAANLDAAS